MIKHGYDRLTKRFIYHCATLQFLLFLFELMHITHWNVVAVHGQGLFFFSSERKAFSDFTS